MNLQENPLHLHVGDATPVHVHIQKPRKPTMSFKNSKKLTFAKTTKAMTGQIPAKPNFSWQGRDRRLDIYPAQPGHAVGEMLQKANDFEEKDSDDSSGFAENSAKKESVDLEESQKILKEKQKELEMYRKELENVELENEKLKKNMLEICDDVEAAAYPEKKFNDTLYDLPEKKYFLKLNENQMLVDSIIKQSSILSDKCKFTNLSKDDVARGVEMMRKDALDLSSSNLELKKILRHLVAFEIDCLKLNEQKTYLLSKMSRLEEDNDLYKQNSIKSSLEIEELKSKLDNVQDGSETNKNLESNLRAGKAHLQNQLKLKEGECNRISTQMKLLERELMSTKLELDGLSGVLSESKTRIEAEKASLKRAAKVQREKAEKAEENFRDLQLASEKFKNEKDFLKNEIEELKVEIQNSNRQKYEKEIELKDFKIRVLELENSKEKTITEKDNSASNHLFQENEDLKTSLRSVESKCSQMELTIVNLNQQIGEKENKIKEFQSEMNQSINKVQQIKQTSDKFISESETEIRKLSRIDDELSNTKEKFRDKEENVKFLKERVLLLEEKIKSLEDHNHSLEIENAKNDEAYKQTKVRLDEKTLEIGSLQKQIDAMVDDLKKQKYLEMDQQNAAARVSNAHVLQLEQQLGQMKIEITKLTKDKQEIERRNNSQLSDLKERLDQSASTNRTMHNYLQFLKSSYARAFNDPSIANVNI